MEIAPHEKLKTELRDKFQSETSYLGSRIRQIIMESDFKVLKQPTNPPQEVKKGDVFIVGTVKKPRPAVVIKVLKDRTIVFTTLTSTENIHCLSPYYSRFFGEGCFTKTIDVCDEGYVIRNFAGVFDNSKALNEAIRKLKMFYNEIF